MSQPLDTVIGPVITGQSSNDDSLLGAGHSGNQTCISNQPLLDIDSQAAAQAMRPGPATQGSSRTGSSSHWNFPAQRKRSASSHIAPTDDLVLSVVFDNTPAVTDDPLHRGNQTRSVPTVLANRSTRAGKSARSRFSRK